MPGGVTIVTTVEDQATPMFQRLGAAVQRPDIRRVMGRAIATRLRKHFSQLDAERPNKLGGTRTHFYGQARRGVQQPDLTGDGVKVAINNVGIAQRYFGGDITPKVAKWLTLPVHPEAYGHRAREFGDLDFVPLDGQRRAMLVRSSPDSPSGIGEVFFLLVKRVHQEPDPTVLPSSEDLQGEALQAGDSHLNLLKERAQG